MVFGLIADAAASDDRVYVLDSRLQSLRSFTTEGEFVGTTARSGRGPGEYYIPVAVATSRDTVFVLDSGNRRVYVYTKDLELVDEVPLPYLFEDMCVTEGSIILAGYYKGRVLHEVDRSGDILRSFGRPPEVSRSIANIPQPEARERFAEGLIACGDANPRLGLIHRNLPIVRSFDLARGTQEWEGVVPEYEQMRIVAVTKTRRQYAGDEETGRQHTAAAIVMLANERILVQLGVLSFEAPELDEGPVESWIFDGLTGEVLDHPEELPRVVAVDDGEAVLIENVPFPRFAVASSEGISK